MSSSSEQIHQGPRIKNIYLRLFVTCFFTMIAYTVSFEGAMHSKTLIDGHFSLDSLGSAEYINYIRVHFFDYMLFAKPFAVAFSLLALFVCRRVIDRKSILSMGFRLKGYMKDLSSGMFMGFIAMALGFLFLFFFGNLSIVEHQVKPASLISIFSFCLLVSLIEEIVFRGYIQNNLMLRFNKVTALIWTSVLFALIHGMNPSILDSPMPLINLFLAGLVLGITYLHNQNLWWPLGFHLTWNFSQGAIFGFEVSGIKELSENSVIVQNISGHHLWTGGHFGFEGSILCSIFLITILVILHMTYKGSNAEGTHSAT